MHAICGDRADLFHRFFHGPVENTAGTWKNMRDESIAEPPESVVQGSWRCLAILSIRLIQIWISGISSSARYDALERALGCNAQSSATSKRTGYASS